MNVASIDIGSNTILLLIGEVNQKLKIFNPFINRYEMPRLGKGLYNNRIITPDRIETLIGILSDYKKLIEEFNCEKVFCTATNAMRIAENSEQIKKLVFNKLGFDIEIISGEREAELSYKGASSTLPNVSEKLVLDIGGGSSEIIFGIKNELKYRKSFPIGAVNLTEKYIKRYPPTGTAINNLQAAIFSTFEEISDLFPPQIPLIAVAGTPTSLAAIVNKLNSYDDKIVEGFQLSSAKLSKLINEFSKSTPAEILNNYGDVIKGREDVILAGAIILKHIVDKTQNRRCVVSGKGIRYGSIVEFLEG